MAKVTTAFEQRQKGSVFSFRSGYSIFSHAELSRQLGVKKRHKKFNTNRVNYLAEAVEEMVVTCPEQSKAKASKISLGTIVEKMVLERPDKPKRPNLTIQTHFKEDDDPSKKLVAVTYEPALSLKRLLDDKQDHSFPEAEGSSSMCLS